MSDAYGRVLSRRESLEASTIKARLLDTIESGFQSINQSYHQWQSSSGGLEYRSSRTPYAIATSALAFIHINHLKFLDELILVLFIQ
jgi:hypothetical protein